MFDITLKFGLQAARVRLDGENYRKFQLQCLVGGETVVLTTNLEKSERNLKVPGDAFIDFSMSKADPRNNIAVFTVSTLGEIKEKVLSSLLGQKAQG